MTLPCFAGSSREEFFFAAGMNRFYSAAADALYRYALSMTDGQEVRRSRFLCRTEVEKKEDDGFIVTLHLSFQQNGFDGSRRREQKSLRHCWKKGVLLPEKKKKGRIHV